MKMLSLLAAAALSLGLALATDDAEAARRFGGGKSVGMQRQATTPAPAPAPSAAPSTASPRTTAAPPQTPRRSWMGPLAGLAAGLGLAALASHFGFGEELASVMMIGLLVMAGIALIGFLSRRRAGPAAPDLRYAGANAGGNDVRPAYDVSLPASGSAGGNAPTAGRIPADFDVEAFVRNAKVHFIRLQAANDAGNLDDLREFTTPEMFAEARMAIAERGTAAQQTDVVSVDAEVLDVAEEAARYVVSVRFKALIREDQHAAAESVDEIWHLTKPKSGPGGWVVAGIQQAQ